ncbi:alkaline phosphatase-like [Asterias rubens]|uniref:alkaline phosphatase-like n=1 Tax=Asterias rubens TaxID=7604 RepID=UPI001455737F|nr:alkaline phosphatase-like [Asterias rubens]
MLYWPMFLVAVLFGIIHLVPAQNAKFWNDQAHDTLQKALNREASLNRNIAKNVVLFVGDGMGVPTITAARILKGQQAGMPGEETVLAWEDFPSVALSKNYNTNSQVSDSAGAACALLCGTKTKRGVIGVDDHVTRGDCESMTDAAKIDSILVHARNAGKATGFVTTTRVTHATPSNLYAHSPDRNWEDNSEVPPDQEALGCTDIAKQLMELGSDIKVIMGGGRSKMIPYDVADYEYPTKNGSRTDDRNLITEWIESKDASRSRFVWNLDEFNAVDPAETDHLLGLFEPSHMQYEAYRQNDTGGEPSIAEMVEKAIKILQKDDVGFVLVVEGGRIDHAHHDGLAALALLDTIALEEAVVKVMELTEEKDTLIVVTADHSHVMTIGGWPVRGNPILGLYDEELAEDGFPYPTLSYTNGPGGILEQESYETTGKRRNLTDIDTDDLSFVQPATFPLVEETHGGEDVTIYARGPMSHLFHGVHEQHYVSHVIRYAACLGNAEHCDKYVNPCVTNGATSFRVRGWVIACLSLIFIVIPCLHA